MENVRPTMDKAEEATHYVWFAEFSELRSVAFVSCRFLDRPRAT